MTTGLTKFDDRPESFRAWQSSFTNAIHGLDLTTSEELDLLVKWLGKELSEHVRRICFVHVTDLVWDRLLECYTAPEVTESALFRMFDSFLRITSKDHTKLRKVRDLHIKLQSTKEDGYFPGLAYLVMARHQHNCGETPPWPPGKMDFVEFKIQIGTWSMLPTILLLHTVHL